MKNQLFEIDTFIKPPLKWVGGKSQLLNQLELLILEYIKFTGNKRFIYHEPFFGGGALYFDLWLKGYINYAYISDINSSLINFYKVLQNIEFDGSLKKIISQLNLFESKFNSKLTIDQKKHIYTKWVSEFNKLKVKQRKSDSNKIYQAALLLAINKTCFNGVYRENQKGCFNVPFNKSSKKLKLYDEDNLAAVQNSLKKAKLSVGSFTQNINFKTTRQNHLLFLDPPYIPLSSTSNFSDYSSEGFSIKEHKLLAEKINKINQIGGYFILTNSNTSLTQEIYNPKNIFYSLDVDVSRSVNSVGSKRKTGLVKEVIITNIR